MKIILSRRKLFSIDSRKSIIYVKTDATNVNSCSEKLHEDFLPSFCLNSRALELEQVYLSPKGKEQFP